MTLMELKFWDQEYDSGEIYTHSILKWVFEKVYWCKMNLT